MEKNDAEMHTEVNEALRLMCQTSFGVLDKNFLCQSLGVLNPKQPLSVHENDTVEKAFQVLCQNKVGCLVVNDERGVLRGIFSERDFLLKAAPHFDADKGFPISKFMTADPVTQPPDGTIAFALTLMSQGGFRHIPIVDSENMAVGIISVKDIVDYIVGTIMSDLLNFEVATP